MSTAIGLADTIGWGSHSHFFSRPRTTSKDTFKHVTEHDITLVSIRRFLFSSYMLPPSGTWMAFLDLFWQHEAFPCSGAQHVLVSQAGRGRSFRATFFSLCSSLEGSWFNWIPYTPTLTPTGLI